MNLPDFCYYFMFKDCTSLIQAPELPATNLGSECYETMFYGCSSLIQAPSILPAETLFDNCYNGMFYGCSSLIQAPELQATTLASTCCKRMFFGCSSLNNVNVSFSNWYDDLLATEGWLDSVAAKGTITCPAALPEKRGIDYIPDGWTRADKQ